MGSDQSGLGDAYGSPAEVEYVDDSDHDDEQEHPYE